MQAIPMWAQAGFWGLVAGGALVLGAVVGYRFDVPRRLIAAIRSFRVRRRACAPTRPGGGSA